MRSAITGLVVCALASGVVVYAPGRPAVDRKVVKATVVVAEPSEEIPALMLRSAAKEEVLDRLVAGELRLDAAVSEYLALDQEWPGVPLYWYDILPGQSVRERVAQSIIWSVELRFVNDPRGDAVLCRLACEFGEIAAAGDGPTRATPVAFVD